MTEIQFPYADPVWNDGDVTAPPGPDVVPPFWETAEPKAAEPEPAPELPS